MAEALREQQSHTGYLEALLQAEVEERERNTIQRRLREARLPRMRTLEEFDFAQASKVSAAQIRELSEGSYIERSEPVLFMGECGTGKTHLMTGLCVAACRQKRRVRFTTTAALVNELAEAKQQLQLSRSLARWARYELIAIDEVGYVPLAEVAAEFVFQVIADRAEKAAVMLTTNLPFSEWTSDPQRTIVQGVAGPHHRPGAHYRNRRRLVSFSPHAGEEDQAGIARRVLDGRTVFVRLRPTLRPTGSATAGAHKNGGNPSRNAIQIEDGPK